MTTTNNDRMLVTVPTDAQMASQPAATIAKAQQVKTLLVAVLAIIGITLSPELSTNVDLLIQSGVAVAFGAYALYGNWRQGQQTKDAVFAPATVERIAKNAAASGSVDILPGKPGSA